MGRSSARRMLTGPRPPDPAEQIDRRSLRRRVYSDDARALLEHVWMLMGMPCGKYLVVMLDVWLPLMAEAGDLDQQFVTSESVGQLKAMSSATVDRYLKPARDRMRVRGSSTTRPSPLLRNSITIRTCADEAPDAPGVVEADTVAHCGPTLIGEYARTLTMTDIVTGWTQNASIRNNASKWMLAGIDELTQVFPFVLAVVDSDCGSEFVNHNVVAWLQGHGYTITADGRRSRIYDDPATPWQRLLASGPRTKPQLAMVAARIDQVNPADLTRQITAIQIQLLDLAQAKTEALAAARHIDMEALQPSITRLTKTK